jgi:hypothetical protein
MTPQPYLVECPVCHAQQSALLLDDGTALQLRRIRTTQAGITSMAHQPTCPLRHQRRNHSAANSQAPLF